MIRELDPAKDLFPCCQIVTANWDVDVARRFKKEVDHLTASNMAWPPVYYVAEVNGDVVGFAGMIESWIMHGVWDLIWINIAPEYQRTGIGRLLTEHRIAQIKERGGAAIHLMTKQYSFFRRLNFKVVHVYEGQWALMVRQLRELTL